MTRRGYIDHEKSVVFFWSQKSGCTTFFSTMVRTYGNGPNSTYHRGSSPWQDCLEAINGKGYASAVICRNPYDRIISCYINKFVNKKGVPYTHPDQMDGFGRKMYRGAVAKYGIDPEANEMSFDLFLKMIARKMATRKDADLPTVNGHCDTQVPPAMLNFEYGDVVRMETFDADFAALCDKYSLTRVTEAKNATKYASGSSEYLGGLPAQELFSTPLSKVNFRSQDTDKRIASLYAVDFETFGYAV